MPIPLIIIAVILIIGAAGGTTYYLYQSGYFNQFQGTQEKQQQTSNQSEDTGGQNISANPVAAIPVVYP